ncbi:MAG: sel1 repeat family protein, partial [Proteobacteria bacterium]|nr:sel1 repeat family protein [Pseudomonadota bacterium]
KAMQWYQKAAEAGDARAMDNIGVLYERGWGIAQNPAEAILWYRRAAAAGDETARENLARLGVQP